MSIFTIAAGVTSRPHFAPAGAIVKISPATGASVLVEYTKASAVEIANGVATWAPWPRGAVTAEVTDQANNPVHLRLTPTGGTVTLDIEHSPSIDRLAPFRADWGGGLYSVPDANGNAMAIAGPGARAIQFVERMQLPKWRVALAKMRAGGRNARLAILGSSTPAGYGAQDAGSVTRRALGQVPKLVALLDKYYAPAYDGSTFGSGQFSPAATFMTFDSRVNLGAGWDLASTLTNLTGHYFKSSAQTALLKFTPDQAFNKTVVWLRRGPTSADCKIAICTAGGAEVASLNVSTQALDGMYSYTVGGGALAADFYNVQVTQTNALTAGVTMFGIETYDSNKTGIQVLQWGRGGITAASFLQSGNAGSPQDCIAKMGADLAFVALGSNYWNSAIPIDQMVSEMQQLITSLKAAGTDVILEGPHKTAGATPLAVQKDYIDALAQLAYVNGLLFVDMWSYFGEYGDAITNGLAPTTPDNTHVGSAGHSLYSQVKFNTIMRL